MFNQEQTAIILNIAKRAGDVIMDYYQDYKDVDIEIKDDDSPVTKADLAANSLIIQELNRFFPEYFIISEENSEKDNFAAANNDQYFIIDPLDGTSAFIKKSDEFTVNIAFIKNEKPIFGVIYLPARDLMYFTDHNNQSCKIENYSNEEGKFERIKTANQENDLIVICTKREPEKSEIIADLDKRNISIKEIITISSSYKFCLIAEGLADLYPRKVNIRAWDVAAGHAIVNMAGGSMVDMNKKEIFYNLTSSFDVPFFEVF